jgi:hypothetical protein
VHVAQKVGWKHEAPARTLQTQKYRFVFGFVPCLK